MLDDIYAILDNRLSDRLDIVIKRIMLLQASTFAEPNW